MLVVIGGFALPLAHVALSPRGGPYRPPRGVDAQGVEAVEFRVDHGGLPWKPVREAARYTAPGAASSRAQFCKIKRGRPDSHKK